MSQQMMIVVLLATALTMDDATRLEDREAHVKALAEDFERRLRENPDACPITTPLRAVKRGDKYVVIAGNNRLLAARRLGIDRLPCIVLPDALTPAQLFTEMFRDNELHRGYSPVERAHAVIRLSELENISHAEAGCRLGISAPEVSKLMRVLDGFPKDLLNLIGEGEGRVPFSVAYQISRLTEEKDIRELADRAARGLLPRERAEEEVKARLGNRRPKPKPVAFKNGHTRAETICENPEAVIADFTAFINAIRAAQKAGIQDPVRNAPQFLKNQP